MVALLPIVGYFGCMAFAIASWAAQDRIYRRLRERYPETWKELGSLTLSSLWVFSKFSYIRFFWRGGSRAVGDPTIERSVKWVRVLESLALGLLIVGVVGDWVT